MNPSSPNSAALGSYLKQRNLARLWPITLILVILCFLVLYWRLAVAFESRQRFIALLPDQTLVVSQEAGFNEAKSIHLSQAQRAARLILGRGPRGFDDKEELGRICTRAAFKHLMNLTEADEREFAEKSIYQKVVVRETALSKLQDQSVQADVKGELIRLANVNGRQLVEGFEFELGMHFVENPSMFENGLYPTLVDSFDLNINPIVAP